MSGRILGIKKKLNATLPRNAALAAGPEKLNFGFLPGHFYDSPFFFNPYKNKPSKRSCRSISPEQNQSFLPSEHKKKPKKTPEQMPKETQQSEEKQNEQQQDKREGETASQKTTHDQHQPSSEEKSKNPVDKEEGESETEKKGGKQKQKATKKAAPKSKGVKKAAPKKSAKGKKKGDKDPSPAPVSADEHSSDSEEESEKTKKRESVFQKAGIALGFSRSKRILTSVCHNKKYGKDAIAAFASVGDSLAEFIMEVASEESGKKPVYDREKERVIKVRTMEEEVLKSIRTSGLDKLVGEAVLAMNPKIKEEGKRRSTRKTTKPKRKREQKEETGESEEGEQEKTEKKKGRPAAKKRKVTTTQSAN